MDAQSINLVMSVAKSVHIQLANAVHDITACEKSFVPVILDHGWAAYMWDMLRKEIHVLDPLCAQVAGAEQPEKWKSKFPRITRDVFTRDESGVCMLHAIRQYDGNKMM
ncbi:hypothetical protein VPH35_093246 [Triticum aestivum]